MQAHVDHTTPFLPDPPVLGPKLPPFKIGLHMMADLSMLLLIWTISSHVISCPPQQQDIPIGILVKTLKNSQTYVPVKLADPNVLNHVCYKLQSEDSRMMWPMLHAKKLIRCI